ncbi:MAG: response regulator transcription factor [Pseudomonadota bacterium]
MMKSKLVIVDDHPIFRGALKQALDGGTRSIAGIAPGHAVVSSAGQLDDLDIREAGSLEELQDVLAQEGDVALVLLDLNMPGVKGLSGLMLLRAQHAEIPVVVVSAREDAQTVRRCIEIGASGYVPKSLPVDEIRSAVRSVLDGDVWVPEDYDLSSDAAPSDVLSRVAKLTPQQLRVLMMLSEGLLNKQIAFKLGVSEATVKAHVSAILQKLDVDSRTQAVIAINSVEPTEWRTDEVA